MKSKTETIGAIDIGSNKIRMVIAEVNEEGKIKILEDLWNHTSIGRDTFTTGRIRMETIQETCKHIKNFKKVMREYNVKTYKAFCTSGIREAENKEYIIEHIRVKTGLIVKEISSGEERYYIHKSLRHEKKFDKFITETSTLLVNIGSGGVEISVYNKGDLKFTEYVKIGALRVTELLSSLEEETLDFSKVMEEFVYSRLFFIKEHIKENKIENFIALGGELNSIFQMNLGKRERREEDVILSKKNIKALYEEVKKLNPSQLIDRYDLKSNRADMILPTMIIIETVLNMTDCDKIFNPKAALRYGMLFELSSKVSGCEDKFVLDDIISSVWHIAEKYSSDKTHCKYIKDISLSIFDQTLRIHGLEKKHRNYLRIAAILHDIGYYINANEKNNYSYEIIRNQDIIGFSKEEMELIANVVKYNKEYMPSNLHENYNILSYKDKVAISKLAAILKLSEALDISHLQKIQDININIDNEEAIFRVVSKKDILLEQWYFNKVSILFKEVMGLNPVLKRKVQ